MTVTRSPSAILVRSKLLSQVTLVISDGLISVIARDIGQNRNSRSDQDVGKTCQKILRSAKIAVATIAGGVFSLGFGDPYIECCGIASSGTVAPCLENFLLAQ